MTLQQEESAAIVASLVDPITVEVIRNSLNAAAEEMNTMLIRSAYTPVIYEMRDCAVALLDSDHNVLGQSSGLPIFLGNLEVVTRVTEKMYGRVVWEPGDVWILNDAYLAGTHLHDMTVYSPVFVGLELVGFAACRAHWDDVGAKDIGSPTDSTDIYQEGLRLGPTKIVARGTQLVDVIDLLVRNGRFSYAAHGDLLAQIACVSSGETRLVELVARFGLATLQTARDDIFAQTERVERARVSAIPDGDYNSEGCLDNDGVEDCARWVRVHVKVVGDAIEIDLSGSDDVAQGPVNCGTAQAISAARVAYKMLVSPDRAVDGGSFRPLTVLVREGSLLGATEPAPCEWYFTPLGLLIDLIVRALSVADTGGCAAASYGDSMVISISGSDERSNEEFLLAEPTVGGWGAWKGGDGEDALINSVNGAMKDMAIEVSETKYPIYIENYSIRRGSGGRGQWCGGDGVERTYVVETSNALLSLWFERSVTPAWGLFGGESGLGPEVVIRKGHSIMQLLKVNKLALQRGDRITVRTGGGGGYGLRGETESSYAAASTCP